MLSLRSKHHSDRVACRVRRKSSGVWVPLAALLAALPNRHAGAQVLDRYFPANIPAYQDWFADLDTSGAGTSYQPLGMRAGNFIISPSISEGIGYDSDPAGIAGGAGSAEIRSSGAVTVNSDWSRNAFNADLSVDDTRYLDQPSRSFTTWTASAGGTIDYGDDQVRLGYAHLDSVSLPTDAGTFGLTAPVTDQVDDLRISDTIGPGPLTLVPALTGQLYRFSSTSGSESLASLGAFNRDVVTPSITAGYQFAGGHNIIVILNDSYVTYGNDTGIGAGIGAGIDRPPNYNDVSMLVGIEYRQSALFVYRALVGYEERFAQGTGKFGGGSISAPAAELDVIWTPTVLTSLTGRLAQSLQDEPTAAGQGVTQTSAQLILDYAFRRNVMLEATAEYARASFPNGGGVQSTISGSAEARWSLTRNLSLSLRYDFTRGDDSAAASQGFTRNQVLLRAKFQL